MLKVLLRIKKAEHPASLDRLHSALRVELDLALGVALRLAVLRFSKVTNLKIRLYLNLTRYLA